MAQVGRFYQSCCSWSNATHAGISFRKIKKAGEVLQQTGAQEFLIKQYLWSSEHDPTPMVACVMNPLGFLGNSTGLLCCPGNLKYYLDVMSCSENKATLSMTKINIYLLVFLLLASSNTQPEKEYHFYICSGIRQHYSMSVQKKFFLSAMGKMIVLPWTMKGLKFEYCFLLKQKYYFVLKIGTEYSVFLQQADLYLEWQYTRFS